MSTIKDALFFARHGQAIIPLHSLDESGNCDCAKGATCPSPAKHPRWDANDMRHGVLSASRDEEQVKLWWNRWPGANIGWATGSVNRMAVLDVDPRHGGDKNLHLVMNGDRPQDTLMSETGSGGWHIIYETDEKLPSQQGLHHKDSGLDFVAENGYVVAPTSLHKSGKLYRWLTRKPKQPLPAYLRTFIVSAAERATRDPVGEEDWGREITEGQRDVYLTRMAGSLLRSRLPYKEVLGIIWGLNRKNCTPPVQKLDVVRIVRSIFKKESKRRNAEVREEAQATAKEEPFAVDWTEYVERFGQQDLRWMVKDWLPEATLGLCIAPPATRKTWSLQDMALSLATGHPFLSEFEPMMMGNVLNVQQEDNHGMLLARWAKIMNIAPVESIGDREWSVPVPRYEKPAIFHHITRSLSLKDKSSIYALDAFIRKHQIKLVIIDPLYSLLDLKDYGADSAREMLIFKTMRDVYGVSFMIAHHTRKGEETGRLRDSGWGSQFLNAWLETGWQIRPASKINNNVVKIERHFKAAPNPPLLKTTFDIQDWHYKVTSEVDEEKIDKADVLREMLESGQKLRNYAQIQEALGIKGMQSVKDLLEEVSAVKINGIWTLMDEAPKMEKNG